MTPAATEPLLAHVSQEAGIEAAWLDRVASVLLGPSELPRPEGPRPSGLCYDGLPFQVCLSAGTGGTDVVLIGDPCTAVHPMARRVDESAAHATALLGMLDCVGIAEMVGTTIDSIVPRDQVGKSRLPLGAMWLAASVTRRHCAVYTCASWGADTTEAWDRIDRWTQRVLRRGAEARRVLRSLRPIAMPSSACIEGAGESHARAKVYFRLRVSEAAGRLGFLPVATAAASDFLEEIIGQRALPLPGLVLSAGFLPATGELVDAKIDVCAHCVARARAEWATVFAWIADRGLPTDHGLLSRTLALEGAELACLGIGADTGGNLRVNTYWKPLLPREARAVAAGQATAAAG